MPEKLDTHVKWEVLEHLQNKPREHPIDTKLAPHPKEHHGRSLTFFHFRCYLACVLEKVAGASFTAIGCYLGLFCKSGPEPPLYMCVRRK